MIKIYDFDVNVSFKSKLFADDVTFLSSQQTLLSIENNFIGILNQADNWCMANNCFMNQDKTPKLVFTLNIRG